MKRETAKRLHDARVACDEIAYFTNGRSRDDIASDRGLQLILQTLVSTIGEALGHVRQADAEVARAIPDLNRIIGMRNQIVHGYDSIDYGIVWRVATDEVPRLAPVLAELLETLGPDAEPDESPSSEQDRPDPS